LVLSVSKDPYSTQSVWLAIGYLLLILEELGLSTVPYTPPDSEGLLKEVGVPKGFRLEAIFPLGFSKDDKLKEPRLKVVKVTYRNVWGKSVY
jgi:nitroreductase